MLTMNYLTFFERDALSFLYQFLTTISPKTDEERELESVAKLLVSKVEVMQAQRQILNEQYELSLRSGFSEIEQIPDSGGGTG